MSTVCLIDAPGIVYRFYHAIPPLSTSTGIPTNAVYGFTKMLLTYLHDRDPTHVAMCFDLNSRVGRLAIDPNYKATRTETPSDMGQQMGHIKHICELLGLAVVEYDGWEADDVVGTLTKTSLEQGHQVEIVTADKDFQQLLEPKVVIWDHMKNKWVKEEDVVTKYGLQAYQMRDYQALIGDKTDNVPNVPGIGPKTAMALLKDFGSIDNLIANTHLIPKPAVRRAIEDSVKQIYQVFELVSFRKDLPIIRDLARKPLERASLAELFNTLEFSRRMQPLVDALEM
jgi:DNA polymerase-1